MPTKVAVFIVCLVLLQIIVSFIYSSNIIVESDRYNSNTHKLDSLKLDIQELENIYSQSNSIATLASASAALKPLSQTIDISQ